MIRRAHPDDLKVALTFWERDRLLCELAGRRAASAAYRLMFDSTASPIRCKVRRMNGADNGSIVIDVNNAGGPPNLE